MRILTQKLIKPKYFYSLYILFYILLSININWLYFIKEIKRQTISFLSMYKIYYL